MTQHTDKKVAVLGSGGGALAVAADMSRHGRHTVLADFDNFRANLEPVAANGGVQLFSDWYGTTTEQVQVADSIPEALDGAELIVVVVPCFGHIPWVEAITPHVSAGQAVLFLGEGSGAIVARRALNAAAGEKGPQHVIVAEANTLPYLARPATPTPTGTVTAFRKSGGVLIAALPSPTSRAGGNDPQSTATSNPQAADTAHVMRLIEEVWPYATATTTVWDTVLTNYNAIDHVAAMVCNAGTLQNRTGGMLLWGEGATPAVVNVIEAVDQELCRLRVALGSQEHRRYQDFLVAQGFAPDLGPEASLYQTIRASKLVPSYAPTAEAGGLNTRYVTEDVPYALVLASSLGEATATPTPVIDGLIEISSVMLERDFRAEGRTLAQLGLQGLDATALEAFAATGQFPT